MLPLYRDPGWTFPFAESRLIPRFFLPGATPGTTVDVHRRDPATGRPGEMIASGLVEADEGVAFEPALLVRAGETLIVLPTTVS